MMPFVQLLSIQACKDLRCHFNDRHSPHRINVLDRSEVGLSSAYISLEAGEVCLSSMWLRFQAAGMHWRIHGTPH